jgi:hypothetical protein
LSWNCSSFALGRRRAYTPVAKAWIGLIFYEVKGFTPLEDLALVQFKSLEHLEERRTAWFCKGSNPRFKLALPLDLLAII